MKITKWNEGMVYESDLEGPIFSVEMDKSYTSGCIHWTHEISIVVRLCETKVELVDGWEIACEEIQWIEGDDVFFEHLHPGVLNHIFEEIQKENYVEFSVKTA